MARTSGAQIVKMLLILTFIVSFAHCQYEVGVTYNYFFDSSNDLSTTNMDKPDMLQTTGFSCISSIFCTSVNKDGYEFSLKLTGIHIKMKDSEGKVNGVISGLELDRNFSKPFTFTIFRSGGVACSAPEGEAEDIIDVKQGIISQFITFGENAIDTDPIETLDNQGMYLSHYKKEKSWKEEGDEVVEFTRRYTHEDFIHFKDEAQDKDPLGPCLMRDSERKKMRSRGVLLESTSDSYMQFAGKESYKQRMQRKRAESGRMSNDGGGDEDEYNGIEVVSNAGAFVKLLNTKRSNPAAISSRSRSLVKHNMAEPNSLPMKPLAHFSREFYASRIPRQGRSSFSPLSTSAPQQEKHRRLQAWNFTDPVMYCPSNNPVFQFDFLDKYDDTKIFDKDMPYLDQSKSHVHMERRSHSHSRAKELLSESWPSSSSSSSSQSFSMLKPFPGQDSLLNTTSNPWGIFEIDCPLGLDRCYAIGAREREYHGDKGRNFGVFVLAQMRSGGVHKTPAECKLIEKGCNFGLEVEAKLDVLLFAHEFSVIGLDISFTRIEGYTRSGHITFRLGKWDIVNCKFVEVQCITYGPDIPGFDKEVPDLGFVYKKDKFVFKFECKVGLWVEVGVGIEVEICPYQGYLGLGIPFTGALRGGVKLEVKVGLAYGGLEISAGATLGIVPTAYVNLSINAVGFELALEANPLDFKVEIFAFLTPGLGGKWPIVVVTVGTLRLVIFRKEWPLPFAATSNSYGEALPETGADNLSGENAEVKENRQGDLLSLLDDAEAEPPEGKHGSTETKTEAGGGRS